MNFEIVEILDWLDGAPELFVLENFYGDLYLGYYYETNTDVTIPYERFLITSIDLNEMVLVKYRKYPILRCFEKPVEKKSSLQEFFIMETTSNTVSFEDIFACQITPNMLPPESYVYE